MSYKCPECGVTSTDEDFHEGNEKCSVWMDNNGKHNFQCYECEKEWIQ